MDEQRKEELPVSERAKKLLQEIVEKRDTYADFITIEEPIMNDLLLQYHQHAEKGNSLAHTTFIALAEHMIFLKIIANNLGEATQLLQQHGIDFDSMVSVSVSEDEAE